MAKSRWFLFPTVETDVSLARSRLRRRAFAGSVALSRSIRLTCQSVLVAVFALLIAGCDQDAIFENFIPQEESAFAKEVIAKLAAKDFAAIESLLDDKLKTPDVRTKLEQMVRLLPPGEPKAVRTVGATTNESSTATRYDLTFEYEYANSWVIAIAVLERRDGNLTVQGIRFVPQEQSLAAANRFTVEGKGVAHYLVFALAISIPLFIVYAIFVCARTRIPKRKWLWILFIAVGLGHFQFNWTTGQWAIHPFGFVVLGAGYFRGGPMAPYILGLAFPLGAVIFLARRRWMQRLDAA